MLVDDVPDLVLVALERQLDEEQAELEEALALPARMALAGQAEVIDERAGRLAERTLSKAMKKIGFIAK